MSGLATTASAGVGARVAPAATSSAARLGVRFHTVTRSPAVISAMAIARPIGPRPITVTAAGSTSVLIACSSAPRRCGRSPRCRARSRSGVDHLVHWLQHPGADALLDARRDDPGEFGERQALLARRWGRRATPGPGRNRRSCSLPIDRPGPGARRTRWRTRCTRCSRRGRRSSAARPGSRRRRAEHRGGGRGAAHAKASFAATAEMATTYLFV